MTTMSPIDQLFHDTRPIADMPFGAEAKPEEREATVARVREILRTCEVNVADDINRLGCTGVVAQVGGEKWEAIETAKFLRLGLAGGGVGLPCFVPISRYCLVHETIGGLEPGQSQWFPKYVNTVSRELTPEEHGRVAMIRLAQERGRKDPDKAADLLGGRDETMLEDVDGEPAHAPDGPAVNLVRRIYEARLAAAEALAFKCSEHSKLNWACRHCIAQAIVEGTLEPVYAVETPTAGGLFNPTTLGQELEGDLARLDREGAEFVCVSVRVATFTRKLSRD